MRFNSDGRRNGAPAAVLRDVSQMRQFRPSQSTLLLLVLGILANDHDAALALDDLALLADGLNGRSHFHDDITSYLHRIAPAVQPFG